MRIDYEILEETNMLFEMIKTGLITGLTQRKIKRYLRTCTHSEIRNGYFSNGKFIVKSAVDYDIFNV